MGTEQRKWSRKSVIADAFLYACDGRPIGPCRLEDVSVGGAKLTHSIAEEIPAELVLSLSRNGQVRRRCQLAWQDKKRLGVRFIEVRTE
jgi:hypothetical protein